MPCILVADDNSNIQKMVTTALKGEGFDVISVGNGQAAVQKMPEVAPDLVLADIFMPVRSGYEVCEYIKNDSRYSHIPVVLLVGAFDPLDENEAQRVRADGVLKKPFVPPDPLISMVKELVAKSASDNLVPVAAPVAVSATAEAAHSAEPEPALSEPVMEEFSDTPPEEFAPPEPAMPMGGQDSPLAFGSLLEATVDEPEVAPHEPSNGSAGREDDSVLTAMRDPSLGEPVFWSNLPATEEPTAEEATEEHAWNETAPPTRHDDSVSLEPEMVETDPLDLSTEVPQSEAVEQSIAEPDTLHSTPSWPESPAGEQVGAEPLEEEEEELEGAVQERESAPLQTDSESPIGIEPALELTAGDNSYSALPMEELPAPEPNPVPEQTSIPEPVSASEELPALEQLPQQEAPSWDYMEEPSPVATSDPEDAPAQASSESESSPVLQEPVLAWDPEPLPAVHEFTPEEFAQEDPSSEPAPLDDSSREAVEPVTDLQAAAVTNPPLEQPAVHESAIETPVEAAPPGLPAHATDPEPAPVAPVLSDSEPDAPGADVSPVFPSTPSPELVDAVVSRILERMQPQVIEVVTREILRPVVEALVHRELTKE